MNRTRSRHLRVVGGWLVLVTAVSVAMPAPAQSTVSSADRSRVEEVTTITDPAIQEASGLVFIDGNFVTANDSGNDALLYAVDALTGKTVTTTRFAEAQTDVEALAPASATEVWVGDIGDNLAKREGISVTRVAVDGNDQAATATTYPLFYAHHIRRDAEAMIADPNSGRLYVITKSLAGGSVYQTPATLHADKPNKLTRVGHVSGFITDAAFWPDGRHIVVRTYTSATIYTFPDLELVGEVALPLEPQGEAIAVGGDGSIYVTSEGANQPVLRVQLPRYLKTAIASDGVIDQGDDPGTTTTTPTAAAVPKGRFRPVMLVVGVGGVLALIGLIAVSWRRTPRRAQP